MTIGYVEKEFLPQESDMQKINTFTRHEFSAESLYVFSAALCNNDVDRDYEKFSVEALTQLKEKFLGKTGICDHSMKAADQKARIFDTWVEKVDGKKTADGEDFYQLKAKAYMVRNRENEEFITEIEAGIKKEISVSCSMGSNVCSICGNDRKNGRCEHIPGRTYNGKIAFTVLSDALDAYEFSFVAVPAQREAGVTKSLKNMKGRNCMTQIIKSLKDCGTEIVLTREQADEIVKSYENLMDEAELGREYKKSLAGEVVSLCAKAMPDMDLNVFSGVAQVMTTKELLSFKKAFEKSDKKEGALLQLRPEKHGNAAAAHSNYKI